MSARLLFKILFRYSTQALKRDKKHTHQWPLNMLKGMQLIVMARMVRCLAWIGKILWGKIDAKAETFSTSSYNYNGSTFFANAEIGGIKGKANGSFNSTDKYLSEKFSGSLNRLLSSVESPSHIPTYNNREFGIYRPQFTKVQQTDGMSVEINQMFSKDPLCQYLILCQRIQAKLGWHTNCDKNIIP